MTKWETVTMKDQQHTQQEKFSRREVLKRSGSGAAAGFLAGPAGFAEDAIDSIWINQFIPEEDLGKTRQDWLTEQKNHSRQLNEIEEYIAGVRNRDANRDLLEPSSYEEGNFAVFGDIALSMQDSDISANSPEIQADFEQVTRTEDDFQQTIDLGAIAATKYDTDDLDVAARNIIEDAQDNIGQELTDEAYNQVKTTLTGDSESLGLFDINIFSKETEDQLQLDSKQLRKQKQEFSTISDQLASLWSGSVRVNDQSKSLGTLINGLENAQDEIAPPKEEGNANFATAYPFINERDPTEFRRRDANFVRTGNPEYLDSGKSYGQNKELFDAVGPGKGKIGPNADQAWEEQYGSGGLEGLIKEAENARYAVSNGSVQAKVMEELFGYMIDQVDEWDDVLYAEDGNSETPTETSTSTDSLDLSEKCGVEEETYRSDLSDDYNRPSEDFYFEETADGDVDVYLEGRGKVENLNCS